MRIGTWQRIGVAALAVGLAAVGCGNDDDAGGDNETKSGTVEFTGPPITVVAIGEYSAGGIASTPEIPDGIEAGVEAVNRDGGINGSELQVEVCDTNNDPNTAAECGRQAVDMGAAAVLSGLSLHGGEYLPLLVDAQIPAIGIDVTGAADLTSEAAYSLVGGAITSAAALPVDLAESGFESIVAVVPDIPEAAVVDQFGNQALARYGLEIQQDIPVPEGAPDMAPYVQAVQQSGAESLMMALPGADATNFIVAMKQAVPDFPMAVVATELDQVREALSDEIVDSLMSHEPFVTEGSSYDQYTSDMEAAGFDETGAFRINGYTAVQVFADVAGTLPAGGVTSQAMWGALPQQSAVETGLLPPLDFTMPVDVGVPGLRVFNLCTQLETLVDGKAELQAGEFTNPLTGEACPSPST